MYHTPEAAERLYIGPLTEDRIELLRECWRIGDHRPVEIAFGIRCHHYRPVGVTPEEQLADIINDVRGWISALVEYAVQRADRRVP
ncbi:MAG: hypothetical protein AB7G47_21455 [Mycolicibacterium sp.]|uniref:hypothetical protein n=1 Tax=Mycolicibacterium sp. TaxID=2320850 RepID=UPI003D098A6D